MKMPSLSQGHPVINSAQSYFFVAFFAFFAGALQAFFVLQGMIASVGMNISTAERILA